MFLYKNAEGNEKVSAAAGSEQQPTCLQSLAAFGKCLKLRQKAGPIFLFCSWLFAIRGSHRIKSGSHHVQSGEIRTIYAVFYLHLQSYNVKNRLTLFHRTKEGCRCWVSAPKVSLTLASGRLNIRMSTV